MRIELLPEARLFGSNIGSPAPFHPEWSVGFSGNFKKVRAVPTCLPAIDNSFSSGPGLSSLVGGPCTAQNRFPSMFDVDDPQKGRETLARAF